MSDGSGITISYLADRPGFVDLLAGWLHEQWGHLNPGSSVESRREELRAEMNRDRIPVTFVAHEDAKLFGSATLRESDLPIRPQLGPWLGSVFVASEARRRGIGTRLVRTVEEKADELGVETLYLFTFDRERFYADRGWERVERTTFRGEPIVVMRKEVDGGPRPEAEVCDGCRWCWRNGSGTGKGSGVGPRNSGMGELWVIVAARAVQFDRQFAADTIFSSPMMFAIGTAEAHTLKT